jgi:hypothetical protein
MLEQNEKNAIAFVSTFDEELILWRFWVLPLTEAFLQWLEMKINYIFITCVCLNENFCSNLFGVHLDDRKDTSGFS